MAAPVQDPVSQKQGIAQRRRRAVTIDLIGRRRLFRSGGLIALGGCFRREAMPVGPPKA